MNYELFLYSNYIPNDIRYYIFDYLEPVQFACEIKNKLKPPIIYCSSFSDYLNKRFVKDFICLNPNDILAEIYEKLPNNNIRYKILLYHYFSFLTTYTDYTKIPQIKSQEKFIPGYFGNEDEYTRFISTIFNYEISNKKFSKYELIQKPFYKKHEIIKLLNIISHINEVYTLSMHTNLELSIFVQNCVLDEFIYMVSNQKPKIIASFINRIMNSKLSELNKEKYLNNLFKQIMHKNIVHNVLLFSKFECDYE